MLVKRLLWSALVGCISGLLIRLLLVIVTEDKQKKLTDGKKNKNTKKLRAPIPQKIDVFLASAQSSNPEMSEEDLRAIFPRKFEVHGHVVVVRMNDTVTVDQFRLFAAQFAESFRPVSVHVVLCDTGGIEGELRKPTLETLYVSSESMAHRDALSRAIRKRWAEAQKQQLPSFISQEEMETLIQTTTVSDTFTVHVENGIRYGLDVRRVMFCSGNTTERMHFAAINAKDEVVVDMFTGIGYFTLPLAKHGGVKVIHALEKNPDSVAFLKINAIQNSIRHLVKPQCGDNRIVGEELGGQCDRVLMGYIPTCKSFLPRALFFLRKSEDGKPRGVIHYHFLADKVDAHRVAVQDVKDELGDDVAALLTVADLRCVKSYAPKRYHYVADFKFD